MSITLAVTGHRRLADDQRHRIETKAANIIATLAKENASVRIVSCLADGADQLVAQVGLDHGCPLVAVLPFPRTSKVHRLDRTDGEASLEAFDKLVAQAERVIELSPDYDDDLPWDSYEAIAQRNIGYAQANLRMLAESDILITIWDGKPNNRICCTAQVVEEAKKRGMSVWWVHSVDPAHEVMLLESSL
jgi:hypothetical protein